MTPLIIFDFDGTLADSFPWFSDVINDVAKTYDFKQISDAEKEQLRGMEFEEILQFLSVPKWKIPAIVTHVRLLMSKHLNEVPLFPGVHQVLTELHEANCTLAVVSSNSEANVRAVLGNELCRYISSFDCGVSLFGKTKKIKKVVKSLSKGDDQTIIYVGDEVRDILAAKQADVLSAAVTWGYTNSGRLSEQSPDILLNDIIEMKSALLF